MHAHLYNRKPSLCLCHYTGEISALLSAKNSTLLVHPSILIARPDRPSWDCKLFIIICKKKRPTWLCQSTDFTHAAPATPKSNKEIVADLKALLDVDVKRQKRLELAIEKDVKKIRGLAVLEKKVLVADELNTKIQSNLAELNRLDRSQSYHVANALPSTKLHYYVDESLVGMIDHVNDRLIIFRSQLDKGIMNKPTPPPPPLPPRPNITDSDATPAGNDADAVDINADPAIALDVESDADSAGSN
eukprot:scaffold17086_cov38-Cyclotella_meneghiniana.AAC.2